MAETDITYTESAGEVVEVREVPPENRNGQFLPRPRLCHLRRWEGMSYGFNLISKKDTSGHFIDNIEFGTPAYYSGLKDGDRVVEVDGRDVTQMLHRDVVGLIKDSGKEGVKMLVVDIETERYFRDKGYVIKSSSNKYQIDFLACPLEKPDDEETSQVPPVTLRKPNKQGKKPPRESALFKRFSDPEPPSMSELSDQTVYSTLPVPDPSPRSSVINGIQSTPPSATRSKAMSSDQRVSKATTDGSDSPSSRTRRDQPVARLCQMMKSSREPYGFIIRTYSDTNEKIVSKLDKNGIAQRTGVKEGDFIIEINGINVAKENHSQVTSRINSIPNELSILVVGAKDMPWFRRQSVIPRAKDCAVFTTRPTDSALRAGHDSRRVPSSTSAKVTGVSTAQRTLNPIEQEPSTASEEFQLRDYNSNETPERSEVVEETPQVANGDSNLDSTLQMSVSEARQKIANGGKKKNRERNMTRQENMI